MIWQKIHKVIHDYFKLIQRFADRLWFPPFVALLAALDNFIIVIPTDGILISSSIASPKRWFIFALSVTIGSTLGAFALATIVEIHGLPWILEIYPGITDTQAWTLTHKFFEKYGLLVLFIVGMAPFAQQPAIILASLAGPSLLNLAAILFFSRLIKFLIMAFIATHAPRLLMKIWGIKTELADVGLKLK